MKLFEQLLDILQQLKVKYIFGVPGDAINPLIEALRKQDEITFIHVAHEEAGALAASAIAKLTGQLAVCAGTVGPGAIHLLNGLYDAKKDHAPVLAITGQIPTTELGTNYHQEVDLHTLFGDVALYRTSVYNPEQMPRVALEACNSAINNRGVSVLNIPHDVGSKEVFDTDFHLINDHRGIITPDDESLNKAASLINRAKNISILAGEGSRNAKNTLFKLAEKLKAPIINSLKAADIVPADHPYSAGGLGLLGTRGGVEASQNCDLLLIAGSDFPYRDWYPEDAAIVRIDRKGSVIGRRAPNNLGIIGDCKIALKKLIPMVSEKSDTSHLEKVRKSRDQWEEIQSQHIDQDNNTEIIHPQLVASKIGELANDEAIFSCDTGAVTVWAARHLKPHANQRLILSFNLASMAFAMPGAIGAQLAFPGRQIVSLSGDGGFNMLMGDFLTAVKYKLPINVVIFNNRKLGLIKMEQEVEGYPESETNLQNPDYAALAKSFGARGFTVTQASELDVKLQSAFASPEPCLIDVHVNPDELTIPPKINVEQAFGYGLSKMREFFE
ncbi:MAG: thiamine pyrophosphate-binding protein [Balneolaceae bacterium]|jgi:thiamine pyrophosphate-dependent acetolactate synthase large subunit-like protein